MARFVTLVNRSEKPLRGTWNGRQYILEPGKHEFVEAQAIKFKEQNPIMGSMDSYSGEMQYLMGIVEHGDPLTPIEQSTAITLADITEKLASGEYKIVRGNGLFNPNTDLSKPLPIDGVAFVKP